MASLAAAGAVPVVHDPMYTDDELRSLGLSRTTSASQPTRSCCTPTMPVPTVGCRRHSGARTAVDGRRILDPEGLGWGHRGDAGAWCCPDPRRGFVGHRMSVRIHPSADVDDGVER